MKLPGLLRPILLIFLFLTLLGSAGYAVAKDADLFSSPVIAPQVEPAVVEKPSCSVNREALLRLINNERARIGAPLLVEDETLAQTAGQKLTDMETKHFYGHNALDGSKFSVPIFAQGIRANTSEDLDENSVSPESTWESFKGSAIHYASLTDAQFTRVGIATKCTDFVVEKSTGPADNSKLVGGRIIDLTVVHLAGKQQ